MSRKSKEAEVVPPGEGPAPVAPRHEEWHVTVEGVPTKWFQFCVERGVKPLYIELNNFELQLMCALSDDPALDAPHGEKDSSFLAECDRAGFKVVRVKHEVSALRDGEKALYWECHAKIDGPFRSSFPMASRDLFRGRRWYCTRRLPTEFDGRAFAQYVAKRVGFFRDQHFDSFEFEACLTDTNPKLDEGWR